ncbi:MAG: N(4)-(beta-N-acetylglucosaminyl)-L-asparaginase [Bacteroidetes bacterium]|nr:N(4)-(beta-N-acetylglucosaminyl)-L-asparaginase [Bacteroidota bacterium]
MINRRKFLRHSVLSTGAILLAQQLNAKSKLEVKLPLVISTWAPNVKANKAAWEILSKSGRAIDAIEKGVMVTEADPEDTSVGYGGLPDRDGRVTLDACIMDELGGCGSVMCIENIIHPVSVARLVMEKTPHVVLVGEGAYAFALQQGFKKENLLTPNSEKIWKEWLKSSKYNPMETMKHMKEKRAPGSIDNHDTIGMLAMDVNGNLSGACSTSGMAFKMKGRVGDSPIIGAGLFVDNEVGAATATGVGEEVIRICGSHTGVEEMRYGKSPREACQIAVERMYKLRKNNLNDMQIGFIAVNKSGEMGAFALREGFNYCYRIGEGVDVVKDAEFLLKN